jgi:hypothetical protein
MSDHVAGDRFGNIMVKRRVGYDIVGWSRKKKDMVFFWFGRWSERG